MQYQPISPEPNELEILKNLWKSSIEELRYSYRRRGATSSVLKKEVLELYNRSSSDVLQTLHSQ